MLLERKNSMPVKEIEELYNKKNLIDGIELLRIIKNGSLKVVFFDPQYRGC